MWETPKTDWHGSVDEEGVYTGDRFNFTDYNRIKNNLQYLRDLSVGMYDEFDLEPLDDKTVSEYAYADEINTIEDNLVTLIENTIQRDYGTSIFYVGNTPFIDFNELNRIEGATLDLYIKLTNQYEGRRMFTFMLGEREVFSNGSI